MLRREPAPGTRSFKKKVRTLPGPHYFLIPKPGTFIVDSLSGDQRADLTAKSPREQGSYREKNIRGRFGYCRGVIHFAVGIEGEITQVGVRSRTGGAHRHFPQRLVNCAAAILDAFDVAAL